MSVNTSLSGHLANCYTGNNNNNNNNTNHRYKVTADENIINMNKYRFPDFYYEELEKLNTNYNNHDIEQQTGINNINYSQTQPVSIPQVNPINQINPINPFNIPGVVNERRSRLDSLNNLLSPNSPNGMMLGRQRAPHQQSMLGDILDGSLSNSTNSLNTSTSSDAANTGLEYNRQPGMRQPILNATTAHQIQVKRVYDNYICLNLDSVSSNCVLATLHEFATEQLSFLSDCIKSGDPFNLVNISTISIIFDRMSKIMFPFKNSHTEIVKIVTELDRRNPGCYPKLGILDTAIHIISLTATDLEQQPLNIGFSNPANDPFAKSLVAFTEWVYKHYTNFWMAPPVINMSLKLANGILGTRFGPQISQAIYDTLKLYFIPAFLFSVSRANWKFSHTHKREIWKLRNMIIPPSHKTSWLLKASDLARDTIPWIHPDTPNIKNIPVFIDGRNWFYSSNQTSGLNLENLRACLNLRDYEIGLADNIYGRIVSNLTGGRQLNIRDSRYIIPVLIFNEKYKQFVQPITPPNRVVLYSPRGQDDDLLALYLWLGNPGSFFATNDQHGNYAARLSGYKYYEGLWSELSRSFKITNPFQITSGEVVSHSAPF